MPSTLMPPHRERRSGKEFGAGACCLVNRAGAARRQLLDRQQQTSDGITPDRIASALVIQAHGAIQIPVADPTLANSGAIHIEIDRAASAVMEKDDAIPIDVR